MAIQAWYSSSRCEALGNPAKSLARLACERRGSGERTSLAIQLSSTARWAANADCEPQTSRISCFSARPNAVGAGRSTAFLEFSLKKPHLLQSRREHGSTIRIER